MGLIGGIARTAVIAGTATAVSNRVSRRQYSRWAEQDQQQYYQQPGAYQQPVAYAQPVAAPATPAPSGGGTDPIEQLKQLAALKSQGVLTDDEFAAAKAKILG